MTTLPRCLHKRLIIRFLWLLCILGAFYTLAVFALWSRASIPPHNSRGLISAGPGTFKAHNSPNQPSNAASQPSSTPQLQRIQQADASEQSSATASQSPGRVFVHTFYYAWYGTLQVDGAWIHVSHKPQATNHKPQTPNHEPQTANHKPQMRHRQSERDTLRSGTTLFCLIGAPSLACPLHYRWRPSDRFATGTLLYPSSTPKARSIQILDKLELTFIPPRPFTPAPTAAKSTFRLPKLWAQASALLSFLGGAGKRFSLLASSVPKCARACSSLCHCVVTA